MIMTDHALGDLNVPVVMVDGSFDPIHDGHIRYFSAAAAFGLPVFCNVAPDSYTSSKHPVLLPQEKRILVLDAITYLDFVYPCNTSTVDVLKRVQPRIYAKGGDWHERGGVPRAEREICDELGIEIRYLNEPRNSSTKIIENFLHSNRWSQS